MQRYRVNVKLLVALVVGAATLLGGSYGLYAFQRNRNANSLLERGAAAREAKDYEQTTNLLIDYLRIRPGDEKAMVELSEVLAEMAESPTAEPRDIRNAIGQLETTVRDFPDRADLRRRLVDIYMSRRVRMLKPALDHVSQLLNRDPGDAELEAMRSECYFAAADPKAVDHGLKLLGYDAETESFDSAKAVTPADVGVYTRVAFALKEDRNDDALAEKVIARLTEANPESGKALLAKGQWLELSGKQEEAIPLIRKALELEPDDTTVVISNARLAMRDDDDETAEKLLEAAIQKKPTEAVLYQTLSDVAVRRQDLQGALAACDRGIAAVSEDQSQVLQLQKARLQLQTNDPAAARATIAAMRKSEMMPSAYPDYLEARLMMADNRWLEAVQTFEKYQSFFANIPGMGPELNIMLGLSREKLGQDELALEAFNQAVRLEPANTMARLGRDRILGKIGRKGEGSEGVSIYAALAVELAKPKAEQDWEAFDKQCVEYIKRLELGDAMLDVLRGEVQMRRGNYAEARKLLLEGFKKDPDNLGVRRAAVKLFAADPDQGAAKALALLDEVVKKFGDLPILRLERADLLSAVNDENLTEQLFALTEGIDGWETSQKVQLWRGLAEKFARLRDDDSRVLCLQKVAELEPTDLPVLLEMFAVAIARGDTSQARQAQDAVQKVVGSKEDATWMFTEASILLADFRLAGGKGEGAAKALELVDRALAQRREWHELHNLKADIAVARGDIRAALESYDQAARLGRQDPRSLFQYIKLLRARGRNADALAQMENIARESRVRLLGTDYAESLLAVGRDAEALEAAQAVATEAPNNAAVHLWRGRLVSQAAAPLEPKDPRRAELTAAAGEAFAKAVELDESVPESWLALVGHHAARGDAVKADDTIRRAQLALIEDQNLLMFARCYEIVGRGVDAESLYRVALEAAIDSEKPRVSRLLAQFYLSPVYRRPDAIAKATPIVNGVLKAVADGSLRADDENARWARSTAARIFAASGAYQDLRNAERLIASNSQDGVLPVEDRLLMAEILSPRPEPVSRLKAARLLEEVGQNQRLSKKSELDLGRLYFALGDWGKCREQMLDVIGTNPEDAEARLAYIEMLLQRGGASEVDLAVRQVARLREIAPNEFTTREMLARVAFKKGKKQEAAAALASMVPRDPTQVKPEQIPVLNRVAQRLTEFEEFQRAQAALELAAKIGGVGQKLVLARFIGEHIDAEKGLEGIRALREELGPGDLVQAGIAVLRAVELKEGQVPAPSVETVRGWLAAGLREDPDLITLRLQEAELLDLTHDYEKAADAYRKLLERKDLTGVGRAVVLNNLAYLLALSTSDPESVSEAQRYCAEAVEILGPGTEILDTRAVIAIADKRYDDAVEDLKLAVIDRPTAAKYFHLATAHLMAGQEEAAQAAWGEALERGLSRETVSRLEREQFDRVKRQLEAGGLTSTGS